MMIKLGVNKWKRRYLIYHLKLRQIKNLTINENVINLKQGDVFPIQIGEGVEILMDEELLLRGNWEVSGQAAINLTSELAKYNGKMGKVFSQFYKRKEIDVEETENQNEENVGYDNLRILENIEVNLTVEVGSAELKIRIC